MEAEIIISLFTLILLEVVLGIDNVIFISILSNKLPETQQKKARLYGLFMAMGMRLALLAGIVWIMKLDKDLFFLFDQGISIKDLILILGGLFLLYKSSIEIYNKMEREVSTISKINKASTFAQVLFQILIMDMVFSIDSIITAIGMVKEIWIMYVAIIISVLIMLVAAEPISNFVNKNPSFKILALSFLLLIGFALLGEGIGIEIPKGYIYFSMGFSMMVSFFQMRAIKNSKVEEIQKHYETENEKVTKKHPIKL